MKSTYAGVTLEISNRLLEPVKVIKNAPIKSNKFGTESLYYDGKYYFAQDIKENDREGEFGDKMRLEGREFKLEVVFYSGKWMQDTFYITREFKEFLEQYK